jgi:hypothetical protein
MARSEARIFVEIWDDPDFIVLNSRAQLLYLFLISQRDTEHTGVLPLRERRWASRSDDLAPATIGELLTDLDRANFIVVDEEAEEVFVRSLIRRDKVYRQPNVMRAALDHVPRIASKRIRAALAAELDRIAAEETMTEGAMAVLKEMREALADIPQKDGRKGTGNPSPNPSDMSTGKGSEERTGERGKANHLPVVDSPSPDPRPPIPDSPPPETT